MYLVLHTFGNTDYFHKLPLQMELSKSSAYNALVALPRERNEEIWEGREVCGVAVVLGGDESNEVGNGALNMCKSWSPKGSSRTLRISKVGLPHS